MRDLPQFKLDLKKPEAFGNLAEKLDGSERRTLATDMIELIGADESSMSEWLGEARGYLDRVEADRGNPTPGNREQQGSGEEPPPSTEMTLTSVIQFAARATGALLGEPDLVRASEPGGEALAAWVSRQFRTVDPNWTLDTDPLIVHMAVTGLAWRKRAHDEFDKTFHSHFLTCEEVIINKNVRAIERAPRITQCFERYPYEIERSIRRGHWIDYEPVFDERDPQAPKKFYECDAWLDLDDDGIEEPWTVTMALDDHQEVVKIKPLWSRKTIVDDADALFFKPVRRFYPYRFLPHPKGGFFPMGFGKLLDRVENSADRLLEYITDTAQSAASNGGVYGGTSSGLPASMVELKPNRANAIPTDGQPIERLWSPFPQKQVSPGSVQIFEKMMTLGDRLAGTLNTLENAPASMTATLAKGLIDNGTQIQSAVHRRIVASLTQEARMFVQMADAYDLLPQEVQGADANNVEVTADPQLATEMHRSALGGLYMEMVQNPIAFSVLEAAKRFCEVMRLPDPEKLVAQPQTPQPTPHERMQGIIGLMKQKTEAVKTLGGFAVALTQSMKNLADANAGTIDARMALLQMAQLEDTVKQMIAEASNAGAGLDGMGAQPGNGNPAALPPLPGGADGGAVSGGGAGGPDGAGASGGAA